MTDEATPHCSPCRGGVPPMDETAARAALERVPDWQLLPSLTRLQRRFDFPDFAAAWRFVDRVSELAEQEQHHPELTFGWGFVEVRLWTHKINGLHENDFILAERIDALPAETPVG